MHTQGNVEFDLIMLINGSSVNFAKRAEKDQRFYRHNYHDLLKIIDQNEQNVNEIEFN